MPSSRLVESFLAVSLVPSRSAPWTSPVPGLPPPSPSRGSRACGLPTRGEEPQLARLPAGESCRSKLVLPLRLLEGPSFSPCEERRQEGSPTPSPGSPGLPSEVGRGGRCRDDKPLRPWGVADPSQVHFFPAQRTPPRRQVPAPSAFRRAQGARGPSGLGALPLCGLPARLRSCCLRSLGTSALHRLSPERGRCLGQTSATSAFAAPALHSAAKRGEPWGQQRGSTAWQGEEGSALPWSALWLPGCSQRVGPSATGAQHKASKRCDALYSQVSAPGSLKRVLPDDRLSLELVRFIVNSLHEMNEHLNQ